MANAFNILNIPIGDVAQGGKTYATAPTPPAGDDSTKIATTAWVKDATPSIPSGNVAVWSRDFTLYQDSDKYISYVLCAPSGGSWFCFGSIKYGADGSPTYNETWSSAGIVASGGAELSRCNGLKNIIYALLTNNGMAIKIA